MGAGQSKADSDEKVFYSETPVQDVVNHLADTLASPETSSERQSTLDAHVRSRINAELSRLRQEEEEVKNEIEQVLEKENLDRERNMAGEDAEEGDNTGTVKNSSALMGDLEEVRLKVERFHSRRDLGDYPGLKEKGEELLSCYQTNPSTPLNCWRQAAEFKASVAQVEQRYVNSLR